MWCALSQFLSDINLCDLVYFFLFSKSRSNVLFFNVSCTLMFGQE